MLWFYIKQSDIFRLFPLHGCVTIEMENNGQQKAIYLIKIVQLMTSYGPLVCLA